MTFPGKRLVVAESGLTGVVADATWTTYNTGTVLSSASAGSTGGIEINLTSPSTVSGTPDAMGGLYTALSQDAAGNVNAILTESAMWLLQVWSNTFRNSNLADRHIILCVYNDNSTGGTIAPSAATEGIGCGIKYFSDGNWMVTAHSCIGSGWSHVQAPGNNTDVDTEGSRLEWIRAQGSLNRYAANPITLSGDDIVVANRGTVDQNANTTDGPFNSIAIGVGWETGTGGIAGTQEISGSVLVIDPHGNLGGLAP